MEGLSDFCFISTWAFYLPLFGTLINLGVLYWKRHSHPLNLVLLSTFTLLEASTLGVVVAFYDNRIVMQALLITMGVFLGLTLFTFQSKVSVRRSFPVLCNANRKRINSTTSLAWGPGSSAASSRSS